ncbi:MAG: ABC transporter substrate-binding protein [Alphaproteobacteria bacterium]|nr:ABC transporter substrate-binding protein [Alphaproteobacteria bacterium]
MPQQIALTLACGDYEITRPLIDGVVRAEGIDLTILTEMDSTTRHWRFLRNREFDVAEVSASSYLIARDQGQPLRAIPVFPHRRFRHGFAFVNTAKGIATPTDLIGRKVGVKSFQVTAILWLRGILEHEYNVPHKSIEWVTEFDEDVEFTPPPGLKLTRVAHAKSLEQMLALGEIDALFDAYLIKPFTAKDPRVGRLFPDYKREEMAYVRKTGIFPIMHVVGLRQEIAERHPWVATSLFQAFERAKGLAMTRMENPRIAPLAWYRQAWEEQEAILGPDPWAYGLTAQNRKTLETLAGYSHEQGLIQRLPSLEELFL